MATAPAASAARRAWLIAILVIAGVYLPFTSGARVAGFVADDALYLLMADYFSGLYPDLPMLHYLRSVSHLPPLYSLLLATCGGLSAQLDIAHLVQTLILVAAAVVWAVVAVRLYRQRSCAVMIMLSFAALPATVLFSTEIWSEFLYLLLSGGAVACVLAAPRRGGLWLLAALLAGLAAITRGFGLVLVIALVLVVAHRARRWLPGVLALALAPAAAVQWLELGGGMNYLEIFRDRVADLSALSAYISANLGAVASAALNLFVHTPYAAAHALVIVSAVFAGVAWLQRLYALEFDAIYVLGYLVLLLLWPFPEVAYRLLYPLTPLLLIYAGLGCGAAFALLRPRWQSGAQTAACAALLVLALSQSWPLASRYFDRDLPPALESWRASRYWLGPASTAQALADIRLKQAMVDLMREARAEVPPNDCIYAFHPQAVMFYSRRAAWPVAQGAARPQRPGCRFHILLSDAYATRSAQALWPDHEIVRITRSAGGLAAALVRYRR